MRSVALVGFSPLTYDFVKDSKADEFWSLNYAAMLKVPIPRIDRLFEIHKRDWYLRGETHKMRKYRLWLKKVHPFPIYMQENELNPKKIPSGVRYPIEEICEKLLVNLVRVTEKGEMREKYFTSTMAMMIALAIYEEFDQIELYGVDMESDTEYGYQRPCFEFWMGIALGLGIKIVLPETCMLAKAPVYGYEVVPFIDKQNVAEILHGYQETQKEWKAEMDIIAKKLSSEPDNEILAGEYLEKSAWVYLHEGAIALCSRLIAIKDNYVSRQFLEMYKPEYMNAMEWNKGKVNSLKGIIVEYGADKIDPVSWQDYLNSRASMFANWGAVQIINRLLRIIDFRPVNLALEMNIVEE